MFVHTAHFSFQNYGPLSSWNNRLYEQNEPNEQNEQNEPKEPNKPNKQNEAQWAKWG